MKECEVANFHGQASDAYAYAWMVQGSLYSWITLWHLWHTLNRCKVVAWDRSHDFFQKNKLSYICSMYDTGVKVLSMKINYLAPFYPSPLGKLLMFMLMFERCKVHCSLFSWITLWNLCHILKSLTFTGACVNEIMPSINR
jgi:membrane-associated HD superfamily phosphohydrolase